MTQRTDSAGPKLDACFSPKFVAATGGQIIYVEDDGTKVHLKRADLSPTGMCANPVDLEVPGLDRTVQVHPDWGK